MTCPCDGTYTYDTVTVEVGGYAMTRPWSDYYCTKCGRTVGETMDFKREVYEEHAMGYANPPLYHKGCGDHVTVKNYPARYSAYGWDPPEQVVTCSKCGEIGYDEVVEHLPDEEDEDDQG